MAHICLCPTTTLYTNGVLYPHLGTLSCPSVFSPQHINVCLAVSAQLALLPALTWMQPTLQDEKGMSSWPDVLDPQHITNPSVIITHECMLPKETE